MNRRTIAAISGAGLICIAGYEGYRGYAYKDSVGVPTIGFGTTENVQMGDTITVPRALMKLNQDVGKFEQAMKKCIGDVPMYQYEWDAYVSLTYNIGPGAFCQSSIVKELRKTPPDYSGACAKILNYKRGGPWHWGVVNSTGEEYYYPLTTSGKQQAKSKLSGLALSEPASGWRIKKTKRIIKGLLIRRLREHKTCMGVDQ